MSVPAGPRPKCPEILVCIPCYNAQDTIVECIEPFLGRDDVHVLLVDDGSALPLAEFLPQHHAPESVNYTVVRPEVKVFAEGGRNLGIQQALAGDYRILVFVDSDIVVSPNFVSEIKDFFRANAKEVVVSATIEAFGKSFQYAETLINFSRYLPGADGDQRRTEHLASYAFALNLDRFRQRPCFFGDSHDADGIWWSAEDILFFDCIKTNFDISDFPILNHLIAIHKHPRTSLARAIKSQQRYARAMLRSGLSRYRVTNALPFCHLLTPRFYLMVMRLFRRRRFGDLAYMPLCWLLDVCRSMHLMRLLLGSSTQPQPTQTSGGDSGPMAVCDGC